MLDVSREFALGLVGNFVVAARVSHHVVFPLQYVAVCWIAAVSRALTCSLHEFHAVSV